MSRSQMLTNAVAEEQAWRAGTIDDTASWRYSLSEDCLSVFDAFVQELRRYSRPITEIQIQKSSFDAPGLRSGISLRAICGECLQPVLDALNSGRGFAILERVPLERFTSEEARAVYWVIGQLLGLPFEQDIKGTLLYDVRDTGQDVARGARFSVTNAESSFHNDHSFGDPVPDLVGLLCLRTAKSGGQSQLITAYTLHNELLGNHPDILETLYQPFYFDRRGQFKAGESPTFQAPIFQWDRQELTIRYLHYYIQAGHERAGKALTPDQERVLSVMESLLRRPDFRVEFSLKPGQMLFTNNRWVLHNRTAFEDYPDPERRRHYVRLWLSKAR